MTTIPRPGRETRPRNREASQRALLDAGVELFSAVGYDAATTKAIAARAGLNEQLITRYFGGKAGLLAAVYVDFLETRDNDSHYEELPLLEDPVEEIRRFMLFKHQHIGEIDRLLRIVVPRLILDPTLSARFDGRVVLRGGKVLATRLGELQRRGRIAAHLDAGRMATLVVAQSFALSFQLRTTGVRDAEVIRLIHNFADVVGIGLLPRAPA
jgi:AcrR family transcriptional regulator